MNRKDFIRNSLMALCVSLVPKNLLPSVPETVSEPILRIEYEAVDGSQYWTWTGADLYEKFNDLMRDKFEKQMWGIHE